MARAFCGGFRLGSPIRRFLLVLCFLGICYLTLINISFLPRISSSKKLYSTIINSDLAPKIVENAENQNKNNKRLIFTRENFTEQLTENLLSLEENLFNDVLPASQNSRILINSSVSLCPELKDNKNLNGHLGQATLLIDDLTESEIQDSNPEIGAGGKWKPSVCQARYKVAIIIPYRDRKSHLLRLLDFLFPILQRQLLDFRFIVTEQRGDDLFNKGRIMNAAFHMAQKLGVDCVIFHDVDMFPQDDRNPYDCPSTPRHLGAFVSNLGYQLWYKEIVGGALAIRTEDYLKVNGFSNSYWAWGGEDDDMGKRILSQNYTIERPNGDFVRYSMLKHVKRKRLAPKKVYKLLETAGTRWIDDGVNENGKWNIVNLTVKPLYYHLLVDVGDPPNDWKADA